MGRKAKLTRNSLMARLRSLLGRARVEYHDLPHSTHATAEWEGDGPINIKIDKSAAGDTPCTIHELLHVALDELIGNKFDDELEEVIVSALEEHLVQTISTRSLSWWRSEVNKRIS